MPNVNKNQGKELQERWKDEAVRRLQEYLDQRKNDEESFQLRFKNHVEGTAFNDDDMVHLGMAISALGVEQDYHAKINAKNAATQYEENPNEAGNFVVKGLQKLAEKFCKSMLDSQNVLYTEETRQNMNMMFDLLQLVKGKNALKEYYKDKLGEETKSVLKTAMDLYEMEQKDIRNRLELVKGTDLENQEKNLHKVVVDAAVRMVVQKHLNEGTEENGKIGKFCDWFNKEKNRNAFMKQVDRHLAGKNISGGDIRLVAGEIAEHFEETNPAANDTMMQQTMTALKTGKFAKKTLQMTMLRNALEETMQANKALMKKGGNPAEKLAAYRESLRNLSEATENYISYKKDDVNGSTAKTRYEAAQRLRDYVQKEMDKVALQTAIETGKPISPLPDTVEDRFMRQYNRMKKAKFEDSRYNALYVFMENSKKAVDVLKKASSPFIKYRPATQEKLKTAASCVSAFCLAGKNYDVWKNLEKYGYGYTMPSDSLKFSEEEVVPLNDNLNVSEDVSENVSENVSKNVSEDLAEDLLNAANPAINPDIMKMPNRIDPKSKDYIEGLVTAFGKTSAMDSNNIPAEFLSQKPKGILDQMNRHVAEDTKAALTNELERGHLVF